MANHKSAKKRHRQSLKRKASNRLVRNSVRTYVKKTRTAIEEGNAETALTELRRAEGALARAHNRNVVHAGNARRRISRLATQVAALAQAS